MLWHASDIKSVHVVTLNREKFEDAEVEQGRGKRERDRMDWRLESDIICFDLARASLASFAATVTVKRPHSETEKL